MELAKALLIRFGHLILNVVGVLRRVACCFRRRRRASDVGLPISSNDLKHSSNTNSVTEFQNWDSWNENDAPVSILIEQKNSCVNRNSFQRNDRLSLSEETKEEDLYDDLFKELTPSITKTKKYIIKKPKEEQRMSEIHMSRLGVDLKASYSQASSELGVIEDNVDTWEAVAENEELWDSDQVLKAQRQEERERRLAEHQRKKLEKETQRIGKQENTPIAMKLS